MIRHTVVFTLKHTAGSAAEGAFLNDARVLGNIPGVERFEQLRQVSPKNDYAFGFSMEFADQAAYSGTTNTLIMWRSSGTAGCRRWRVFLRSTTCRFKGTLSLVSTAR